MADDDEVDILGDFSISTCFPGIQSDYENQTNYQNNTSRDVKDVLHKSELVSGDIGLDSEISLDNTGLGGPIDYDENVPKYIEDLVNTAEPTVKLFAHDRQAKRERHSSGTIGVDNLVYNEDDFMIASTEYVGDTEESQNEFNLHNANKGQKLPKKLGNHRRKKTRSVSSKSKFNISVPLKKNIKKDKMSMRNSRGQPDSDVPSSPKLQLVFSTGHAVPVSEGEQVIKIDKNKEAESESDVDIDVGGEDELARGRTQPRPAVRRCATVEIKTAFLQRRFEPVRPRQRKVHMDGDGGCTIMHTESGDLIEIVPEPRKEKTKKPVTQLFPCSFYSREKPAPYHVRLSVSTLLLLEAHAHGSRAEVMGLLGGRLEGGVLRVRHYARAAAAADCTHCDMCPVSQAQAAQAVRRAGHALVGWHHSHPRFVAQPSALDLRTQLAMQRALERPRAPFAALVTSQHWARGRTASHYTFLRVELEGADQLEVGYQLSVQLEPDITAETVPALVEGMGAAARGEGDAFRVDVAHDLCADTGLNYLDKLVSTAKHYLVSAGYSEQDVVVGTLVSGLRDVFR